MVEIDSAALTQVIAHNISVLNEKVMEFESENQKLKDQLISLREETKKRRKVDDHLVPLKENIMHKQEQMHDVRVECFTEIQNIEDKIKSLEKRPEIASQMNQNMESLWIKVEELDIWEKHGENCSKWPSSNQSL